jgi:hypothetical protein
VVDDEPFALAEQLVRDDQGSDRVIGGTASGVANDMRVAFRKSRIFRGIEHPGYSGGLLLLLSIGLALGSWIAMAPILLMLPLMVRRSDLEIGPDASKAVSRSLVDGVLPIPSVVWSLGDIEARATRSRAMVRRASSAVSNSPSAICRPRRDCG